VLLDVHGHIEWCNPIASAYLGLDEQRDLGQPLVNLVRHPDLAAYLEQGEYAEPLTLRLARGEELVLSLAIIAYGEEQKLLLASDITLAEKVETMRRDFVANVSHELKSPLTVVAGFLETLTDGDVKLDERRRQGYLEMMREHTLRMQRLVEDLLTLSALESSRGPGDETLVDVSVLLAGVREEALALSAGRHRIELSVEQPVLLLANAQELRSAFGNLVSNAVRYTPAGGDIRLGWTRRGAQAVFSVADSGPGIEPRHIPRLTERFYRVDVRRSRERGGTGLGLAIVKHIVNRHNGKLTIESRVGEGSTFTVFLPASRKPVDAAVTEVL
jgi:two-component system phosphate regulon sensor histidine kinase PhoR